MKVTAWKNGKGHSQTTYYGVKLTVADRDSVMQSGRATVTIELGDSTRVAKVNIAKDSFENDTCRELIHRDIGIWLKELGLVPWPTGQPPKLSLVRISDGRYRLAR